MKYYAYVANKNGCDYTIGCNRGLFKIEADSLEAARDAFRCELLSMLDDDFEGLRSFCYDIGNLDKIVILEVAQTAMLDSDALRKEYQDRESSVAQQRELARKRREYEKLKAEFGDV